MKLREFLFANNDHLPLDMTEPRLESGEQVCDNLAASHGLTARFAVFLLA